MASLSDSSRPIDTVDLATLVGLFYPTDQEALGTFTQVPPDSLPASPRQLLDHDAHMTITVEAFHGSPVAVDVIRSQEFGGWYAREIVLHREDTGAIVQYGIVRLRPDQFHPDVWAEIRAKKLPLGRVLIQHGVFRQVERIALWRVSAGPALADLLRVALGATVYGRTARIICDGKPAIELLEIVTAC